MRYWKYGAASILGLAAAVCMVSCSKNESNGLMKDANPDDSNMALYVYDGDAVCESWIYDRQEKIEIIHALDQVRAAEAESWSLEDITLPVYGLWIGKNDGGSIFAAWSNGYWIAQDGTAYKFKFDFSGLEKAYSWEGRESYDSFTNFPCARYLTLDQNGWDSALLTPAPELVPPDGITMTLEEWSREEVSVDFYNESGAIWNFGEMFHLQVLLDDTWYEIPPTPNNWAFNLGTYPVEDREIRSMTYPLMMYGELPPGTYRLVTHGLSVTAVIP